MGVNGGEVRGNEARMAEGAEKFRGQLAGAMGRAEGAEKFRGQLAGAMGRHG